MSNPEQIDQATESSSDPKPVDFSPDPMEDYPGKSLLEGLRDAKYLSQEHVDHLSEYVSSRVEYPAHVLLVEGYVSRKDFRDHMVNNLHYDEVTLIGKKIDRNIATILKQRFILRYQALPIDKNGKTLTVAMLDPSDQFTRYSIEQLTGLIVIPKYTSDLDLNWQYHELFGITLVHRATYDLFWSNPSQSAAIVVDPKQIAFVVALGGISLLALTLKPITTLLVLSSLISLTYLFAISFKLLLTIAGSLHEAVEHVSGKEVRDLENEDLPIYTILIPLFKEAHILPKINEVLKELDYPLEKLDIKLLLEQDDLETLEAIKNFKTRSVFDFVVVPNFGPRTKPKACNYGLYQAKGTYLTIFDAEDIPESNQLKKVVALFKKKPENVVCIQAALNYYNSQENFLTKMFTLEYSYWFDYMLRGMERFNIPIPLGGTSNHFRVDRLRELGGWDPYNVTEDADLGIRATARGYRIAILTSTTYEEANSALGNWIRQRSRWIKGYMQTWLVHTRHPIQLFKTVGWRGFLGFHYFIGATPLTFLINPILWGLFILWVFIRMKWIDIFFPPLILYISLFNLLIGNLLVVYMNMIAVFKRRIFFLTIYSLLNPAYWVLHSIAAYKALWQLITKPYYWEKTTHGISKIDPYKSEYE